MNRITLFDNAMSAVIKMCEGNQGAITALVEILKCAKQVDPDDKMGGLGKILVLDTLGIYGTDIYVLWNDICDRNTSKMIAILRAYQFGFIASQILKDACHRQDRSGCTLISVEELYIKVIEKLPNFDLSNR